MRNPNGFGCVYKAQGNRRKPYIARVTIGWDENGKQLFEPLGSYETKAEGIQALIEYHDAPFNPLSGKKTFSDVYREWHKKKFESSENKIGTSASNRKAYEFAYKNCESLYNIKFKNIRTHDLQDIINRCDGYSCRNKVKMLLSQLYVYAINMEIVKKDYSEFVNIGTKPESTLSRQVFSSEEIELLYKNLSIPYIDTLLIMILHGLRPTELLTIQTEDVHLDKNYFICGIKTEAGRNRMIPISRLSLAFVKRWYDQSSANNSKWLITNRNGTQMKYTNYNRDIIQRIFESLELKHSLYDARHSFATYMDKVNANKLCTQKIMGHSPKSLLDKVYTHKTIEDLQLEIDRLETLFDSQKLLDLTKQFYL